MNEGNAVAEMIANTLSTIISSMTVNPFLFIIEILFKYKQWS
jgi:hypothetical protein